MKQRNFTKKEAKNIKRDKYTSSKREKCNIAITNEKLDSTIDISHFGGTNNIFADFTTAFNYPVPSLVFNCEHGTAIKPKSLDCFFKLNCVLNDKV